MCKRGQRKRGEDEGIFVRRAIIRRRINATDKSKTKPT